MWHALSDGLVRIEVDLDEEELGRQLAGVDWNDPAAIEKAGQDYSWSEYSKPSSCWCGWPEKGKD